MTFLSDVLTQFRGLGVHHEYRIVRPCFISNCIPTTQWLACTSPSVEEPRQVRQHSGYHTVPLSKHASTRKTCNVTPIFVTLTGLMAMTALSHIRSCLSHLRSVLTKKQVKKKERLPDGGGEKASTETNHALQHQWTRERLLPAMVYHPISSANSL